MEKPNKQKQLILTQQKNEEEEARREGGFIRSFRWDNRHISSQENNERL